MQPKCLIEMNEQIFSMEIETLNHRFFYNEGDFLHIHPSYHFILVSRGRCLMRLRNHPPVEVEENSLIFINPLVPHAFVGDPATGVEHSSMIWKFRDANGGYALFPLQKLVNCNDETFPDYHIVKLNDFEAKNFIQRERDAETSYCNASFFVASMKAFELFFVGINLLFHEEFINLDVNKSKRIISQVEYLIEKDLSNSKLRIASLAHTMRLNPSYLNTVFKSHMGIPISNHIAQKRIELAQMLIENTNYNISEIAGMCGFNQLSHFSRIFKKICGQSPCSYREKLPPRAM